MKLNKILLLIIALIGAAGLGWYTGFKADLFKERTSSNVNTVMEQVKNVLKLVNVEGQVSEVYDYKSYKGYDISLFRKKILIRVNAKVLVGYDLEKATIDVDPNSTTVSITNFPEPELISVDHDLDYYDIQEGSFNKFSEEELTQLGRNAKEYASSKALSEELYLAAEKNKEETIAMLEDLLELLGWSLKFEQANRTIKG